MNRLEISVFNELKERRKQTLEIILLVVVAGVGINLLSTVIYESIKDYRCSSEYIISLFVTLVVFTLICVLRKRISQDIDFRIFIALKTQIGNNYAEEIKGYAPSKYLEKICSDIFRHDAEEGNKFKRELVLLKTNKHTAAYLNDIMMKLMFSLILGVIKEYGEHTLTTAVLYHEKYRHLSKQFKSYVLKKDNLPTGLRNSGLIDGRLRLPVGVSLDFKKHTHTSNGRIIVKSPFAALEIEPMPYWTVITKKNSRKTFDIAMRNIEEKNNTILLSVPVKHSLSIKRHKIFCKKTELFYEWLYGLSLDLTQWLSWDEYAEGDMERLIVELHKNLKSS